MKSVIASRKSEKSNTLSKFGFTGITVVAEKKTLSEFEKMIVKASYSCDGRDYNIKGTVESNLLIDGSHSEYKEKLIRIIAWSSNEPKFSNAILYVHMLDSFTQFSSSQREAIDNVYYKWRVFAKI
jgi:hypothetical protein